MRSKSRYTILIPATVICPFILLLVFTLGACTPAQTPMPTATPQPPTDTPLSPSHTPKFKPTWTPKPTLSNEALVERYMQTWELGRNLEPGRGESNFITSATFRAVLVYMLEAHVPERSWMHEDFFVSYEDEIIILDWGNDQVMRLKISARENGDLSIAYVDPSITEPVVLKMIDAFLRGALDNPDEAKNTPFHFNMVNFRNGELVVTFYRTP